MEWLPYTPHAITIRSIKMWCLQLLAFIKLRSRLATVMLCAELCVGGSNGALTRYYVRMYLSLRLQPNEPLGTLGRSPR
jgi:hypothetical protein